ncbi:MAG: anthranilate phosphoribosyltransferase [Hyphomicrobiales bacterium]|uniref:anthranilate phosphoribosyltransferase n=1 Tax=Rhabdaerophilum calidifontis TaxID=2604328 RepID=UPI00123C7582|nr:anthranilate phosphoribosyltransferase [Rhabdaerophilum calidifontis]MCA1952075.1 anthranilate phosphoribosyltransferase [Hyphomicrobiales bacterium]MCA1999696.1 anthranilate phosphoribosyltransferase [Hyphomicrobiales bacterium]
MDAFKPLIAKVAAGLPLSRDEAELAFSQILSGESTPAQTAGFLMALRVRGETVEELTGAVAAMRARMLAVPPVAGAIDVVGTGGDASGSWNVSTLAGLIVAACGVPVAKHGNRAASSKSGAADVLQALGVRIGLAPAEVSACLAKAGFAFMVAPAHHPAMRHVAPVRTELGTRTIFNLLGPLSNPAGVRRLLLGVFAPSWLEPIAETLRDLGTEAAWVVHGADGLDEITTTGPTHVVELKAGAIRRFEIEPAEAGLPLAEPAALKGGEPGRNAAALKAVLAGEKNAYRDIALFNAAAALLVAGKVETLREGASLAAQALDSGAAGAVLDTVIAASNAASANGAPA